MMYARHPCLFQLRYLINAKYFQLSKLCTLNSVVTSNACTGILAVTIRPELSTTHSLTSRDSNVSTKWMNVNNLCTYQTHQSAIIDKTFKNESKLRKIDRVPHDFVLIYRVKNELYLKFFCTFGYTMFFVASLFGIRSCFPVNDYSDTDVSSAEIMEGNGTDMLLISDFDYQILILVLLVMSIVFCVFTKRFPLRIYHGRKTYLAVFMNSYFPLIHTIYPFPSAKLYQWPAFFSKTLYVLGRRRARLLSGDFRRPIDKFKMTGETSAED